MTQYYLLCCIILDACWSNGCLLIPWMMHVDSMDDASWSNAFICLVSIIVIMQHDALASIFEYIKRNQDNKHHQASSSIIKHHKASLDDAWWSCHFLDSPIASIKPHGLVNNFYLDYAWCTQRCLLMLHVAWWQWCLLSKLKGLKVAKEVLMSIGSMVYRHDDW